MSKKSIFSIILSSAAVGIILAAIILGFNQINKLNTHGTVLSQMQTIEKDLEENAAENGNIDEIINENTGENNIEDETNKDTGENNNGDLYVEFDEIVSTVDPFLSLIIIILIFYRGWKWAMSI